MKIKFWKYDFQDGRKVQLLLEAIGFKGVSVIGGLWKRGHSNNDIDIHIAENIITSDAIELIMKTLGTKDYILTDWGSLYLKDTLFGTLDIFFKGQTDEFDY